MTQSHLKPGHSLETSSVFYYLSRYMYIVFSDPNGRDEKRSLLSDLRNSKVNVQTGHRVVYFINFRKTNSFEIFNVKSVKYHVQLF